MFVFSRHSYANEFEGISLNTVALAQRQIDVSLPGLALSEEFYTSAMALGYKALVTQGVYKVFEKMNGIEN